MSEKMFSEEQLEQLRSFPEITRDELIKYFTLTPADLAFVDPGRGRGPVDRLGLAVQLASLPWLGFVPDEVTSAPAAGVARIAGQLGVDPSVLQGYGRRAHTRTDHLALAARYLGWKNAAAGSTVLKELEQFLLDRAMEHDSPTLLFNLAREYLLAAKVIRPGPIVLARMIGSARKAAGDLTSQLLAPVLTAELLADLERMLLVDVGLGMTRLEWLNSPAKDASASAVKTSIEKLTWFRNIDAHLLDLSMLPNERRRFLATVARRSTNQGLQRRGDRKFPILLAFVAQAAVDQLEELHAALEELEGTLTNASPDDTGTVRLDDDDHLVVPPLSAEDVPAEAKALKDELAGMLPFAPIASLLIELDARTGFLDCFTHAGGRKLAKTAETKRNILAVLISQATNLGLARMSEACGISVDVLAWTAEWYVREDTLRDANTVIVDHHYNLPLAGVFGGGTMSSSDGQRFPVRGKTLTGRNMVIHGGQVLATYTHVSDQWSTYGTKIIVPTAREAHYVLDDFLGNATDLPITEHATDTHGATLINFALFDLVGKALTPRMRDLTRVTLVRDDTPTEIGKRYPHAGPLLGARWNEDLISDCWPDLLRMAGSLKYGQATASLIVGKWSAASRQNTLAAALKEWGMLRRTLHTAKYLSDPVYRRRISRQLNKGESLHALRRDLHYAQQGTITKPHLEQQTEQAWCLTVLTNAVVAWTTEYYSRAVTELRAQGRAVPDDVLAHISPGHSDNINFFGVINVDVEAELAKLDGSGWRPLRPAQLRQLGLTP
ncbi:Tn3 family transposase [Streptosporangium canum]|uniref:Tn3 family transposase n=1 Tax=Streptosporangium canum TaxID=324952 RepID=UPI0033A12C93